MLVSYTDTCEGQSIIKSQCLSLQILKICYTFSYQQTALHVAAKKGHDYSVECLVNKGADMNIKDKSGVSEKLYL